MLPRCPRRQTAGLALCGPAQAWWCWWGWSFLGSGCWEAVGGRWADPESQAPAVSLSGRGSGSVAACGEGRRGSGRGRAGKGAGKPRVVALRPAWHPPGRKQIREPPDAGVGALGVCQGGRVTSMMLSPEEAPSCTISSSVPELQTRLPERRPGAPWMPRGRTQPQACTSPHVPSRTLQQPSAPPAASA